MSRPGAEEPPDAQRQVEQLVRQLNDAWIAGRSDDLGPFFHQQVVAVPAEGRSRIVGREAMVESFRQFTAAAKVHAFQILDLQVDVFGTTAIARAMFRISYAIGGSTYDEKGTDILVLSHDRDGWQIVWRTQVPAAHADG